MSSNSDPYLIDNNVEKIISLSDDYLSMQKNLQTLISDGLFHLTMCRKGLQRISGMDDIRLDFDANTILKVNNDDRRNINNLSEDDWTDLSNETQTVTYELERLHGSLDLDPHPCTCFIAEEFASQSRYRDSTNPIFALAKDAESPNENSSLLPTVSPTSKNPTSLCPSCPKADRDSLCLVSGLPPPNLRKSQAKFKEALGLIVKNMRLIQDLNTKTSLISSE